jgi:ABC-type antimicrobial peptide transport system permease subunit
MSLLIAISIYVVFGSWSAYLALKLDKANATIKKLKETK